MKKAFYELIRDKKGEEIITLIKGETFFPHFHRRMEITYVLNGQCYATINNEKFIANENELLFVPEYCPHSYTSSKNSEWIVLFTDPNINKDINIITKSKIFPYIMTNKEYNKNYILPIMKNILELKNEQNTLEITMNLLTKSNITAFFARLYQGYFSKLMERSETDNILIDILIYIEEHFKENINLESIADHFGYNKYYFSKIFNTAFNDNISNYLNEIRIREFSKAYKEQPNQKIIQLAYEYGFNSMTSFYRTFKKMYNCSPKDLIK